MSRRWRRTNPRWIWPSVGIDDFGDSNHEFDRGVADFNNRIADPSNGIDWLCANASAANKSPDGLLSHVRDSTIRTVNGKRIGFVGALTDALGSVATPQITRDADLDERAVDAINRCGP